MQVIRLVRARCLKWLKENQFRPHPFGTQGLHHMRAGDSIYNYGMIGQMWIKPGDDFLYLDVYLKRKELMKSKIGNTN